MEEATGSTEVADSSGNNLLGTMYGVINGGPQRENNGHTNKCLSFDGVDDYITTNSTVINPASGSFSAFAWVKGGEIVDSNSRQIISQTDVSGTGRTWLYVNPNNRLATMIGGQMLESTELWDSDQWHFVGLVWDGLTRRIYCDGAMVASNSLAVPETCSGRLVIGAHKAFGSATLWNGLIDDVKIYGRGFSDREVAQMAAAESVRWDYDTLGNRLVEKDLQSGAEIGYISDNVNAYKYVDSNNDGAVGPYDPNDHEMDYDGGNLVLDNRQYSYGYDYENRLNEIRDHTSDLIIMSYYDALGRRVARKIFDNADSDASRTDRYYYNDKWQIVRIDTHEPQEINEEVVQVLVSTREFVYGNGIDEPLFMDRTTYGQTTQTTRHYYIHDNLGSVAALMDGYGYVVENYKYSPWGEPTIYSGSGEIKTESQFENPYLFTAREVDILDGGMLKLQINRHRPYNYQLARWMTADPLGVVPEDYYNDFDPENQYSNGINLYSYVNNMPLYYSDPLGLWGADIHRTLTQQLAEKAGLGNCIMELEYFSGNNGYSRMGNIGDGANWADDNPDTSPISTTGSYYLLFGWLEKLDDSKSASTAYWHFPADRDRIVRPGQAAARSVMDEGLRECDLVRFSKGIHIFQDSWCHQGKPADGNTHMGHARGVINIFGNYVGLPTWLAYLSISTEDPDLFGADIHDMSEILYEKYLVPFRNKCPCACGGKVGQPAAGGFDHGWIPYENRNVVDFDYMTNTYRN